MAAETVQTTTQSKQPSKQEFKEEVKTETEEGTKYEKHEYKIESNPEPPDPYSRVGRAESIIQRNVFWALGAGVLPIPVFDIVAVTAVQVKMLKELSDLYGVTFREDAAKKVVYSLIAALGSVGVGTAIGGSLTKLIPGLGTTLGVVSVPIFAAAFTHAVGKLFLMHFESGGTVLDFDPHAVRSYFRQEYEKAKETVARMRKDGGKEGEVKKEETKQEVKVTASKAP
jgi:uncharacterized protein (DUF697 family)